jgi:DNA mismatch repair protein MutS
VIRSEYHPRLQELRLLGENQADRLRQIEATERERTGINSLKIGYNRVHGYYLEISKSAHGPLPDDYQRRQTLKNAERYVTDELKRFEQAVLGAQAEALALEKQLYLELFDVIEPHLPALQDTARQLAELDALAALATTAELYGWCRPELTSGAELDVTGGRHPVVEALSDAPFVPNDLRLGQDNRFMLITGPNMGGKSTYMRQTALMVVLACMGSFVPADRATIGLFDRIFTRIGTGDDLVSGRSTFMVEMAETARIVHQATRQSLVIIDEIGRGTSTYDGLAIAWAVAGHLLDQLGSLVLFATHYFELTEMIEKHPSACNVHFSAQEAGGTVRFLHQVEPGPADRSYGIEVAQLAGVPIQILDQAKRILEQLQTRSEGAVATHETRSSAKVSDNGDGSEKALRQLLMRVNPDELSPRQALELLYRIRDLLAAPSNSH